MHKVVRPNLASNIYIYIVLALTAVFLVNLLTINYSASATDLNASVGINPSLTLSLPTTDLNLNLNPATTTFGYKDLPISISTNNETGYIMTITTAGDNTNLVNTADTSSIIETLPTKTGGYTDSDFIVNKWGYKNGLSNNYFPFTSGATVLENSTYTNEDSTTLRFATKIDYMQEEGTYSTTFSFNLVVNPIIHYMQDFTIDMCKALASADHYTLVDRRDNNEYTVRYIGGDCWMTRNLVFVGDTSNNTMTLDPTTSDVGTVTSFTYGEQASGDSLSQARLHVGVEPTHNSPTVWYNGMATTATTLNATKSICPKGWGPPTSKTIRTLVSVDPSGSKFDPVTGGRWFQKKNDYTDRGFWYSSDVDSSTGYHYAVAYMNGALSLVSGTWDPAGYLRCTLKATIDDITDMQDITPTIVANTADGVTKTLRDTRDNQSYTVAKINGNVWMTRSLAIGCDGVGGTYGANRITRDLTSTDSNVSSWSTSSAASLTSNSSSYTTPRMACSETYGGYYNFTAATGGVTISGSTNATTDICPAGWRLPTYSEFSALASSLSSENNFAPFYPVAGGYYDDSGRNLYEENRGFYWASNYYNSSYTYFMRYRTDNNTITFDGAGRWGGNQIRCIAK